MRGLDKLKYYDKTWPTDKGAWFPGEKVLYREKSLFEDFKGCSWMTLLVYGITGQMPGKKQAFMVEKIWSLCTSYPDPRLWNNRVAALAGSARSTGQLAHSAAIAVSEAKVYGGQPAFLGGLFLGEVVAALEQGESLEYFVMDRLKKERYLPGFGRPITSKDERIQPLLDEARELGFAKGRHLGVLEEIVSLMATNRLKLKPNIAIYITAIMADMGFTPHQTYLLATMTFSAGIVPCYLEGLEKSEGCLFPLSCGDIDYIGADLRKLNDE